VKKTPEQKGKGAFVRMCASCGKRQHRDDMFRIMASEDGARLCLDFQSEKNAKSGKSSYICKDYACVTKAEKSHRPEKLIGCVANGLLYETIKEHMNQ
jgi:predicted RNA-binding protein YlxR (DUF448 family)